jgi:hypothetical protein
MASWAEKFIVTNLLKENFNVWTELHGEVVVRMLTLEQVFNDVAA